MKNTKFLLCAAIGAAMFVGCDNEKVAVTGVTTQAALSLVQGEKKTLTATVAPENASNKGVSWSSSNVSKVRVVNASTGEIEALVVTEEDETVILKVTTTDGGYTSECAVTVTPTSFDVTDVTLTPTELSIPMGNTAALTAQVLPTWAANKNVTYASDNEQVATVSAEGVVTARSRGNATITVTTEDGSKTATCQVTVLNTDKVAVSSSYGADTIFLVDVEGGTFNMGCDGTRDGSCGNPEKPLHPATVSSFNIGKFEVTQKLWQVVMEGTTWTSGSCSGGGITNPCAVGDNIPVYNISYAQILEFLNRLNTMTGLSFRLPTEAEWEYAARGGSQSMGYKFSGSNTTSTVGWCLKDMLQAATAHPVGEKLPNELGIYDMTGNVAEWVSDYMSSVTGGVATYFQEQLDNPTDNPTGPDPTTITCGEGEDCPAHIYRGGSWASTNNDASSRIARRMTVGANSASRDRGFRLVLP